MSNLTPGLMTNSISAVQAAFDSGSAGEKSTFQAVVSQYLIPEKYGAVGDGVTDDSAAIQAAIDALAARSGAAHDGPAPVAGDYGLRASTRGALVLTAGKKYAVNSTITLKKSVGIVAFQSGLKAGSGLASGAHVLDTTATLTESWDGRISGLIIDGANRPVKGARFRNVQGAQVSGLEVGGCQDDGVTVSGGYELMLTDAIIWAGQGVSAGKTGLRVEGSDSHYTNIVCANYAFAFLLNGAVNNFFTNCHGWGIHTAGYRCRVPFYLTASSSGNTFTGVYADSPSKLDYAAGTAFTAQADGYINGGVGIYIDASCADNGFSGVRVLQADAKLADAGVAAAPHNFPIVLTSSSGNNRFSDVRIAGSGYWVVTHIAYGTTAPYNNPFIRNNTLSVGVSNARLSNNPLPVLTPLLYQRRKDYGAASSTISVFADTAISALSVSGATTVGLDQLSSELDYVLIQHTIQIYNSSASASTVTWAAGVYAASPTLVIPAGKIASVMFYTTNYGVNWYVQLAVVMA